VCVCVCVCMCVRACIQTRNKCNAQSGYADKYVDVVFAYGGVQLCLPLLVYICVCTRQTRSAP
jgi:hypothetical protein